MRRIETTFQTFGASMLLIGLKGESNATEILIDCADALAEYQGTMTAMSITGPDGTVYPGEISLDDNGTVHWVVAARDCYIEGNGSARVDLVDDNGTVVASAEATTIILKTNMQNSSGTEPPDQIADWADAASIVLQNVQQALADLINTDDTAQANETARQLAETGRVSAEQLRVSAEQSRVSAEQSRVSAEQTRVSAEQTRIIHENGRVAEESNRSIAEIGRSLNENGRVTAENNRVTEFNTIRANAQAALSYLGESEDSSTASAAHTAGTYLIYDGKLYKVTADIAIGDTLAETGDDANIEQVPDGVMAEMISLLAKKADKQDTVLDTTLSRGRKGNTTVGNCSIAFGYNVEASGTYSTAHGNQTIASGSSSFADGAETKATGEGSHAEGIGSEASGRGSHAEGTCDYVIGATPNGSTASGEGSHAEGHVTTASGVFSHSEGRRTIANHLSQHVAGEFNIEDPSTEPASNRGTYVEIIGNGTSNNNRSNARTLDWNGNEELAGDLTIKKGTSDEVSLSSLKSAFNNLPTEETGQELLDKETGNAGLTETALTVIGLLFDRMPQNETATDIYYSLLLENERLLAIYEIWEAERSA